MYIVSQQAQEKKEELLKELLEEIGSIIAEEISLDDVFDVTKLAYAGGRVRDRVGKVVVEAAVAKANQWIMEDTEYLEKNSLAVHDRNKRRTIVLPCVGSVVLSGAVLKHKASAKKEARVDVQHEASLAAGDTKVDETDASIAANGTEKDGTDVSTAANGHKKGESDASTAAGGTKKGCTDVSAAADGHKKGESDASTAANGPKKGQSDVSAATDGTKKGCTDVSAAAGDPKKGKTDTCTAANSTEIGKTGVSTAADGSTKDEKDFCPKRIMTLNHFFGLEPGCRVHPHVKREAIVLVTNCSYRKAAGHMGNDISHMTVWRAVNPPDGLPPENLMPEEHVEGASLEVAMDELHVHLQGGGCTQMAIGVVCEGRQNVGGGRTQLVGKRYIAPPSGCGPDLVEMTEAYITGAYDWRSIARILHFGDGGNWILGSLDETFPGQVLDVHDAYHRFKSITHLHNAFPGERVRSTLNKALEKNDIEKRDALFMRLAEKAAGNKKLEKTLQKESRYIRNHWDTMVLSMNDDIPGSFTEPMVQHLAQRFTSVPCAWKKPSFYNLLAYKIYLENGGKIEDIDVAPRVGTRLEQYRKAQADWEQSFMEEHVDFSLFDPVPDPVDGNSGTQHLMDVIGHGGELQF